MRHQPNRKFSANLTIQPLLLAVLVTLSAASTAPAWAAPSSVTVTYNNTSYTIGTQTTNYQANQAFFTSQPWWGNSGLASALTTLVNDDLGLPYFGVIGPFFAHSTSNGDVFFWSWLDGTGLFPGGLPGSNNYAYADLISMSSLVTLESLANSLSSTSTGLDVAVANANLLVHGAHSRPLSRLVAVGEKTAWLAGDLGSDDHGSRDGSIGIAEIGGGYNFGPAQINMSLGKTWSTQHLVYNGSMDADGQYIMAESIIPVSGSPGLFAMLGAYGLWGEADINRGYLNAGVQDYSNASPDTQTWGVHARLDWENAFAVKSVAFSPYADMSYISSSIDGYTETDGGLPARFDSRSTHSTEIRGGLNAAMPIAASKLDLVANIEAVHRLNDSESSASGEVIGLFSFNLPGENYKSTWLKGGVGVEGELGKGKVSLMLNATTDSSMSNAWLAASYQFNF